MKPNLQLSALRRAYAGRAATPESVIREVYRQIAAAPQEIWISRLSLDDALERARQLPAGRDLPLWGVPFAVKDNIDVAGLPTTCACPGFAYSPAENAKVVAKLLEAGAICVGKTNLDQFATGLVGARSPYGTCRNAFDAAYISGGSSSGSALAVALGLVSFTLGTDTAGSGRVPAALNNVVGYKPSVGLLSTRGLVPACASLDCISVFAASCGDAAAVGALCAGYDAADPSSRHAPGGLADKASFRFGVPRAAELEFYGDDASRAAYAAALAALETIGGARVEIELEPFLAAGRLLYSGPWLAERLASVREFLDRSPDEVHPVIREILERGRTISGVDTFRGQRELRVLVQRSLPTWQACDLLALPTAPTVYRVDDVLAQPIELNTRLGRYTTFVNLMDLAAVAVPAGFRQGGLPFGISLIAPAGSDGGLLAIADRLHRASPASVGATEHAVDGGPVTFPGPRRVRLAVVGAHLSGQPLNHQLTSRGAALVKTCRTATDYRLYALAGATPPKPGLLREPGFAGPGIEVEVWELDEQAFGAFVDEVPPPLAIGTLLLDDGSSVNGFVCEAHALRDATEITEHGGWRRYRAAAIQRAQS